MITVTSPLLPDFDDFSNMLKEIWESKWVTNMGALHEQFEKELAQYLGVPFISLYANGTLPLMAALRAYDLEGEVITTPFSFVATSHAIWWNRLTPVFVDVDPETGNMDPARIEEAITEKTCAILPVHVYGQPCDTSAIGEIAKRHNLKLIYDGAHAFGVEKDGKSILTGGDVTTLSFHATKVFNTIEGGAMVLNDAEAKERMDLFKNFGFADETIVKGPGFNGKLDEIRSAVGLLNLRQADQAIARRAEIASRYKDALRGIPGLGMMKEAEGVRYNWSYFPLRINGTEFGLSRDALYEKMKQQGIFTRRYFYPLISSFPPYNDLPSAQKENLPNANRIAEEILCLPIHPYLEEKDIELVINTIQNEKVN